MPPAHCPSSAVESWVLVVPKQRQGKTGKNIFLLVCDFLYIFLYYLIPISLPTRLSSSAIRARPSRMSLTGSIMGGLPRLSRWLLAHFVNVFLCTLTHSGSSVVLVSSGVCLVSGCAARRENTPRVCLNSSLFSLLLDNVMKIGSQKKSLKCMVCEQSLDVMCSIIMKLLVAYC